VLSHPLPLVESSLPHPLLTVERAFASSANNKKRDLIAQKDNSFGNKNPFPLVYKLLPPSVYEESKPRFIWRFHQIVTNHSVFHPEVPLGMGDTPWIDETNVGGDRRT